jgi:hypothetical protein
MKKSIVNVFVFLCLFFCARAQELDSLAVKSFSQKFVNQQIVISTKDLLYLNKGKTYQDTIISCKEQLLDISKKQQLPTSLFEVFYKQGLTNDDILFPKYSKQTKIYYIGKLSLNNNYDSFLMLINRDKDTTFMERIEMLTNNGANIFKDKIAREIYLVNVIANKIVSISLIASYEYGWNCDLYLYSTLKKNKIFISQMSGFADDLYYHLEQNNENVPTSAVSKENPVIRYFTFDEQGFVKILHNNDE